MKIASYNVENLFDRAKAFNDDSPEAQKAVEQEAALNNLFQKSIYSDSDKAEIKKLIKALGLVKSDNGPYAILRKLRGKLLKRSGSDIEIVAGGRADWVGWAELKTAAVNEIAVMNTGRVLKEVNADIVAVIEAEHRVALKQFSDYVLKKLDGMPYPHVMLIDGNDERGIDVGLLMKIYSAGTVQNTA